MTGMKRVVQPVAWNENAGKLPPIFVGRAEPIRSSACPNDWTDSSRKRFRPMPRWSP